MNWKDGQLLLFLIALTVNIMKVPPSLYPYTSPTLNCTIYPEAQLGAIPTSLTEHGVSSVHSIFYPSSCPSQQLLLDSDITSHGKLPLVYSILSSLS